MTELPVMTPEKRVRIRLRLIEIIDSASENCSSAAFAEEERLYRARKANFERQREEWYTSNGSVTTLTVRGDYA